MSDKTTAEPLLSDEEIVMRCFEAKPENSKFITLDLATDVVRDFYEADRQRILSENAALRLRLALMEGPGGEPVAWPSKDQLDKLDSVGDMMVASERDDTFQVPYDIALYTHPSPTSDAALRSAAQVAADALVETRSVRTALYNLCQRDDETRRLMDDVHSLDAIVHTALSGLRALGITPNGGA